MKLYVGKIVLSEDGVTHLNVYSKARTELGRWLTNFAHTPIDTEDGPFESIEGYWYWLGNHDERLRVLHGWQAKDYGRKLVKEHKLDHVLFEHKIKKAIALKIDANPIMRSLLVANKLPLAHYYVYGNPVNPVVRDAGYKWILEFISSYME